MESGVNQNSGKKKSKEVRDVTSYFDEFVSNKMYAAISESKASAPIISQFPKIPNTHEDQNGTKSLGVAESKQSALVNRIADVAIRGKAFGSSDVMGFLNPSRKPMTAPELNFLQKQYLSTRAKELNKLKTPQNSLLTAAVKKSSLHKLKRSKSKTGGPFGPSIRRTILSKTEKETGTEAGHSEKNGTTSNPSNPEMMSSSAVNPLKALSSEQKPERAERLNANPKKTKAKGIRQSKSVVVKEADAISSKKKALPAVWGSISEMALALDRKKSASSNINAKKNREIAMVKSNLSSSLQQFRHIQDHNITVLYNQVYELQLKLEEEVKELIGQMELEQNELQGSVSDSGSGVFDKFKALLVKQKQIIQLQIDLRTGRTTASGCLSPTFGIEHAAHESPAHDGYNAHQVEMFAPYACERDGKMVFYCSTCQVSSESELLFRLHLESPQHTIKAYAEIQKGVSDEPQELAENQPPPMNPNETK